MKQDYETPFLPAGQLIKMVIHSSWGDPYYVGLDGFDILDVHGQVVNVEKVRPNLQPKPTPEPRR